jgi:hypothetical protein
MAFLDAPEYEEDHVNLLRKLLRVVKGAMQGKTNNAGTLTLTANSTTTTVTFAKGRLGTGTHISLTATTTSAATAAGLGLKVVIDVANDQFTITHNNTADSDKIFTYALIG